MRHNDHNSREYLHFKLHDFAADPVFRDWVLNPDSNNAIFWENWLAENPSKSTLISQAKTFVLVITEEHNQLPFEPDYDQEIEKIVQLAEQTKVVKNVRSSRIHLGLIYKFAASIVLVSGICWAVLRQNQKHDNSPKKDASYYSEILSKSNFSKNEMTILLGDGTIAILKKGSTISYPRRFGSHNRIVHLSGEAFFDVAKNKAKPFLVYTPATVVRVLGTSFRVRAFEKEDNNTVLVKTGRVSVYPKANYDEEKADQAGGVVLTPNQQVVFKTKEKRLEKGKVRNPQLLKEYQENPEIVFDDMAIPEVFKLMENHYGIHISFDAKILQGCAISAQFKEESLKQRLNVICQAIGASCEMVDGQIIIKTKGCN